MLVYAKISNTVRQLNWYDADNNNVYQYAPAVGSITIDMLVYNTAQNPLNQGFPTEVRYVLMSSTAAMAMRAQHINPANYNEVSQYLNLGR